MSKKILSTSLVLFGLLLCPMAEKCLADASAQLEQAESHRINGAYQQAEEMYKTITADNPDNPSYADPNLVVFSRDIMRPVYKHTKPDVDEDEPVQVKKNSSTDLTDIVYIDAGFEHSMAIDSNGNVWVWGRNQKGQLGLGENDTDDRYYAEQMP